MCSFDGAFKLDTFAFDNKEHFTFLLVNGCAQFILKRGHLTEYFFYIFIHVNLPVKYASSRRIYCLSSY